MWRGCCRAEVVESSLLVRAASHGLERTLPTRSSSSRVEESDAEKPHDAGENPAQIRTQKRPKIPPKSSPNEAKIDPKWVPGALRDPPGGPGTPRSAPGPPQRRPEGPRERPRSVPGAAQNPPRAPQGGQRGPQEAPKGGPGPPKSSQKRLRAQFATKFLRKPLLRQFSDEFPIKTATEIAGRIGCPLRTKVASQVASPTLANQRFAS